MIPEHTCVHELVSEQAAQRGDRIAVVQGDRQLTYRQLDELANRLARSLIAAGVARDTCVGVCLERSIEQIVTLLAILKAGGAYLPLDPSYPDERLRTIALEARPSLIVTQEALRARFAATAALFVVDHERPASATTAPAVRVHPDQLAYVMSTSGSTGQPKAVAVPHRAIVRLVRNASYATLDADQVILHLAPLAFDASTFEIWGALANGGRLILYPHPLPEPELLRALIRDQRVTTMWLTAGIFHQLVDGAIDIFRPLSQLLVGGDVLSPPHVATALRELPGCTLINGYGPTESTTFACCHRIVAQDEHTAVPIGSPIGHTTAYVLDPSLSLAGIGVVGELYLGGNGLARGYLRRPAWTAERFLPDPFGPPGSRLYRTGDLARLTADGHLEFLGRQDDQVKIRGHRIELGEVDAALRRQPGVRDALVLVRGDTAHDKRLVSYVIPPSAAGGLRHSLAAQLPGYLIPSEIIGLDSFPLTPNGKVDRRALPTCDPRLTSSPAPASELEQALAEIWCDVFGVSAVGRHDNFFDLGGHSLIAMRIVSAYERVSGKMLSVHALLEHATIAELADFVASST